MDKQATKHRIIETAFQLFLDQGYADTSMSNLVHATQLSKGAFYHYFKNKEELYQEVLNRYVISYYKQIDWNALKQLNSSQIEQAVVEFYQSFIPEILALTTKGMSRYFSLFFEAYERYPYFKQEVQLFYTQLKDVLVEQLEREKAPNPAIQATQRIAKYEGLMFWIAVFPEQKITPFL